ncbi:MAG: hypothetical protein ACI9UA_004360, partial [Pseudoalteromonas tetraodonis]
AREDVFDVAYEGERAKLDLAANPECASLVVNR